MHFDFIFTVSQVREIEEMTFVDTTIDDSIISEIIKTLETLVIFQCNFFDYLFLCNL